MKNESTTDPTLKALQQISSSFKKYTLLILMCYGCGSAVKWLSASSGKDDTQDLISVNTNWLVAANLNSVPSSFEIHTDTISKEGVSRWVLSAAGTRLGNRDTDAIYLPCLKGKRNLKFRIFKEETLSLPVTL